MKKEDIKSGDLVFVRGNVFISHVIEFWMKRYAKKKGIKFDWIASHIFRAFWDKNTGLLMAAESVDNGFRFREFDKHYDLTKDDIRVKTPIKPYTDNEIAIGWREAMHLQTVDIGYMYWNFILWIIYIETGLDLFAKHGDKFTYCYLSSYTIGNTIRENEFPDKDEMVSFFDLWNNPFVKETI